MSGAALFAQLAPAADQTTLRRLVFDVAHPPAFTIEKPNLEIWRAWAEIVLSMCTHVSPPPLLVSIVRSVFLSSSLSGSANSMFKLTAGE